MENDKAYIEFADSTDQEYRDLVKQTLRTSEYIELEFVADRIVIQDPTETEGEN